MIQARLAGAIACLHGHDVREDRVRTLILLALIGDASLRPATGAFIRVGNKLTEQAVTKVPGSALIPINRMLGFRFLTKFGKAGVVNLTKLVPVAGGIVSGSVSCAACSAVGHIADYLFGPCSSGGGAGDEDDGPIASPPVASRTALPAAA